MTITDEMIERAAKAISRKCACTWDQALALARAALEAALSTNDPVICPECHGERRIKGSLCPRCKGNAQIARWALRKGEQAPFDAALSGKEER